VLSWNQDQGWIACGGEKGLLKVIKLDPPAPPQPGAAPVSTLSMNQTMEGHQSNVTVVTWNEPFKKLTSSDESGLIIVWMLHRQMWFEEMINNRNKSVVKDMKWTNDGQRICIAYEDGAVIVGNVEGNRLWGKDLPHGLASLEWAPDSKTIIFATPEGDVKVYDNSGNFLKNIPPHCLKGYSGTKAVCGIHWYDIGVYKGLTYEDFASPTLCIAYQCGRAQILLNENDDSPVLIDTGMAVTEVRWNNTGSMVAFCGSYKGEAVVQFYTPLGIHIRTLTVTGHKMVSSLSWEGNGLRIAVAVDSFMYFANIKPDYKWAYFNNTVVYSYMKQDRPDYCVVFWETKTDEKYLKYIKKLINIAGFGEYCVLATKAEDAVDQYVLILCNAIGSPVDTKYISVEPLYVSMNKTHVVVCSEETVYTWQYRSQVSKLLSLDATKRKIGREVIFHVDETPSASVNYDPSKYSRQARASRDPIACVTSGDGFLLVGRTSGVLQKYTLPHIALECRYILRCRPQQVAVNCNALKFSIIDLNGVLTFYDTTAKQEGSLEAAGVHLELERKDVWDMKWSLDNPELLAIMEKTRMYVLMNMEPEEPVISSGYLCEFLDLEIKAVLLEDIMTNPDRPLKSEELMLKFETRSLKETIQLIAEVDIKDAYEKVEKTPHPRLWRKIAEAAMQKIDFDTAHKAFVKCDDYQGICFVNRVRKIDDRNKQWAEVAIYFQNYDEAERVYREIDRRDLALDMRVKTGDWFKVLQLVQEGVGSDKLITIAYNELGDYYADRFRWAKAASHYAMAQNNEKLVRAYYFTEDYEGLRNLIETLPAESPLLHDIGEKLQSVGLCEEAVKSFVKAGEVRQAVDCCVLLNQWSMAVELAEQHQFMQIEGLLSRYASHLLEENKRVEAIELYRKANRNTEAAKLLIKIAKDMSRTTTSPILLKKISVMSALEVDSYKTRVFQAQLTGQMTTAQTLDSLITSDINTMSDKSLDNPWRGAEAYHFYLMAQRQLYDGEYESALKTAIRLQEYENVLETKDIYSLVALAAYYSRYYGECSKALVKLENLQGLTEDEREAYAELAVSIFSRHPPQNPSIRGVPCPGKSCSSKVLPYHTNCAECGVNFPACIASGRPITERAYAQCKACKHKMIEQEVQKLGVQHCPLCHSLLRLNR